jgi:hypothetical protein
MIVLTGDGYSKSLQLSLVSWAGLSRCSSALTAGWQGQKPRQKIMFTRFQCTVRSLAKVAEIVHGGPYRFRDAARFSLAHGGKDRHPYSVPLKVYDETTRVIKSTVLRTKLGRDEKVQALKRLDSQARRLEVFAEGSVAGVLYRHRTRGLAGAGRQIGTRLGERFGGRKAARP